MHSFHFSFALFLPSFVGRAVCADSRSLGDAVQAAAIVEIGNRKIISSES